jgi:hypothetical protein
MSLLMLLLACVGGDRDTACVDLDRDGACADQDCDDADPSAFPGADEVWYDGVVQDCGGRDDDQDQDGFGVADDCDDTRDDVNPDAAEVLYDGVDQDCDGFDGDEDGDGYLPESGGGLDCDDTNPSVHPGAPERLADGVDQDCDGDGNTFASVVLDIGQADWMQGPSLAEGTEGTVLLGLIAGDGASSERFVLRSFQADDPIGQPNAAWFAMDVPGATGAGPEICSRDGQVAFAFSWDDPDAGNTVMTLGAIDTVAGAVGAFSGSLPDPIPAPIDGMDLICLDEGPRLAFSALGPWAFLFYDTWDQVVLGQAAFAYSRVDALVALGLDTSGDHFWGVTDPGHVYRFARNGTREELEASSFLRSTPPAFTAGRGAHDGMVVLSDGALQFIDAGGGATFLAGGTGTVMDLDHDGSNVVVGWIEEDEAWLYIGSVVTGGYETRLGPAEDVGVLTVDGQIYVVFRDETQVSMALFKR